MLRVTVSDQAGITNFIVEGKLVGPWVQELEKCWEQALTAEPSKSMVMNLTAVCFIDREGKNLLKKMKQQGVKFVAAGCMTKAIVEEIEAESGNDVELKIHEIKENHLSNSGISKR